jgi:phosphate transport system substrate-binding protein
MKFIQRGMGIALLFALAINPIMLFAQDDATNVTGSQIVIDILEALTDAAEIDVLTADAIGTAGGLEAFCSGEANIAAANRPLTAIEEGYCTQNQVDFVEYLVGFDAYAVIANQDVNLLECLYETELSLIFAPSSQGQINDWQDVIIDETDSLPMSVYLPPSNTSIYTLLDDQINGFGLRHDATTISDHAGIIDAVENTSGAVGVVSLSALSQSSNVKIMALNNNDLGSCFVPSAETIENRQYIGANRLFLYVNSSLLENETTTELLTLLTDEEMSTIIAESGYTAPSTESYALNQEILAIEESTGRQFSKDVVAFQIPSNSNGIINIGGSANLSAYLGMMSEQFSLEYPGITVNTNLMGKIAGARDLCNGEIDFLTTANDVPKELLENCAANNISTTTIDVAKQAIVIVANANDDYLTCLTKEQLLSVWSANTAETVINWSNVSDEFPETALTLFAPYSGVNYTTDLLLTPDDGPIMSLRVDVAENNQDPLYRAAATANVEGALTYMSWKDYQQVLDNNQANIKLIEIDNGTGCIVPSEETIRNGEYPYTLDHKLIINMSTLTGSHTQSFLWYLFSDSNYIVFELNDMIALTFGQLPDFREDLQELFTEAQTIAARPIPVPLPVESTPEATAEAD